MIMLNSVKTKFGEISVEALMYPRPPLHPRSEEDRIKIYDSDDRYLDYISLQTLIDSACEMETTVEEEYATRIRAFREADDINTLVSLLTTDCIGVTDIPQEDNDYVNRIGKHYILMEE